MSHKYNKQNDVIDKLHRRKVKANNKYRKVNNKISKPFNSF